jgi:hypothetical protein
MDTGDSIYTCISVHRYLNFRSTIKTTSPELVGAFDFVKDFQTLSAEGVVDLVLQ